MHISGISKAVVIIGCFFMIELDACGTVSFRTEYLRTDLSPTGSINSMYDLVHNREYLAKSQPAGLLSVRVDGIMKQPTQMIYSKSENFLTLVYGRTGLTAKIRVTQERTHISFELISVKPLGRVELVRWGPYPTTIDETVGETVGVVRDGQYAIGIQTLNVKTLGGESKYDDDRDIGRGSTALTKDFGSILQAYTRDRSKVRMGTVWGYENVKIPAYNDGGVVGSKIALFGCPEELTLETIGKIEVAEGLPHPMLDGIWAKISPTATASYLIMNFNEKNIDEALKFTKKAGLRYLYHGGPFETWGHFKLKPKDFPDGIESLKRCVEKAKRVDVRLGVHTLSNFITTNDPYVTPVPDKRLAQIGNSILTAAIDEKTTEIQVASPNYFSENQRNWLHTIVIGTELIRYGSVSGQAPWKLLDCRRGAFGTKAASHGAGTEVGKLLDHPYKVFFSNMVMQHEIAMNIADLFNQTGLKQISFDGLEGCYSSGHGQYGRMLLVKECFDNLMHTDVINDASNPGHFSWHIYTRMNWGEPWYGGFRESQQSYRVKNQAYFQRNLMPSMLGWFNMRDTTSLDDIEWLLARAAGFHAGFALCTSLPVLQKNSASESILAAVNEWETARHAHAFSDEQRKRLEDPTAEFHIEPAEHRQWKLYPVYVSPTLKHERSDFSQAQPTSAKWEFDNPHGTQPLQFVLQVASANADQNGFVSNPAFELDQYHRIAFAVTLKPNQHLVCKGTKQGRIYDRNWNLLKTVNADSSIPEITEGKHAVEFNCGFSGDSSLQVLVNLKTMGKAEIIRGK